MMMMRPNQSINQSMNTSTEKRLTALFGEPVMTTRGFTWTCESLNMALSHFVEPFWHNTLSYLLVPYIWRSTVDEFLDCCEVPLKEWLTSPINTEPIPICFVKFDWIRLEHLLERRSNTSHSHSMFDLECIKLNSTL